MDIKIKLRDILILSNKKAQITIFIIVAILLVIVIILFFTLLNKPITMILSRQTPEPTQIVSQCVSSNVKDINDFLIENNFYLSTPALYKEFGYNLGEKDEIPFKKYPLLCYTSEYRAKCIPQEPMLINRLEKEIYNYMKQKIDGCFEAMYAQLEKDNYKVRYTGNRSFSVELIRDQVKIKITQKMSITKADTEKNFEKFNSIIQSPLYELAMTAQEIVRQEAKWCNSEYLLLMGDNPKIEIKKFQTGDDYKIYTIKDVATRKLVRFAVRGCVLPTPA